MGCGGSADRGQQSPNSPSNGVYERRPRISVRIENGVRKLDKDPVIVFIFGGPGSKKGRIVDDLTNSYGFSFIRAENLIMRELPKKVQNIVSLQTSKEVQDFVRENPEHITLEWILSLVTDEVERINQNGGVYVVDLLPNLKILLRMESFSSTCVASLQHFENKFPISFALNLAIPADKVLNAKRAYCATPDNSSRLKESGGQSDEADASRTQKRAQSYESSVKAFLDYFTTSERLLTVDVTCGMADVIWYRVHEVLCDLDFAPNRNVNTVILFAFDTADANQVSCDRYLMDRVMLGNIVSDPSDTPSALMKQLCVYVDKHAHLCDAFVVDVSGTSMKNSSTKQNNKGPVIFLNEEEGYLEDYLPGGTSKARLAGSKPYKAVITTENIISLFPINTNSNTCQRIASSVASYSSF